MTETSYATQRVRILARPRLATSRNRVLRVSIPIASELADTHRTFLQGLTVSIPPDPDVTFIENETFHSGAPRPPPHAQRGHGRTAWGTCSRRRACSDFRCTRSGSASLTCGGDAGPRLAPGTVCLTSCASCRNVLVPGLERAVEYHRNSTTPTLVRSRALPPAPHDTLCLPSGRYGVPAEALGSYRLAHRVQPLADCPPVAAGDSERPGLLRTDCPCRVRGFAMTPIVRPSTTAKHAQAAGTPHLRAVTHCERLPCEMRSLHGGTPRRPEQPRSMARAVRCVCRAATAPASQAQHRTISTTPTCAALVLFQACGVAACARDAYGETLSDWRPTSPATPQPRSHRALEEHETPRFRVRPKPCRRGEHRLLDRSGPR